MRSRMEKRWRRCWESSLLFRHCEARSNSINLFNNLSMKKIFSKIKERWLCTSTISILIILCWYLFISLQNLKFDLLYDYKSVPRVELINTLSETDNRLSWEVRGFVMFEDINKQPKGVQQYIELIPFETTNEKWEQLFLLRNIVAMSSLSPRQVSIDKIYKTNETINDYILEDNEWNQYIINKSSKSISLRWIDWDYSILLTSDIDFRNFILKKQ